MEYDGRPLRSTRRLSNLMGQRPGWYSITNSATADGPTLVSIYDEVGFYGVSAGDFLADLKGVSGDIQVSINSPGGDVFDGIAIFNQLKQRSGSVHVIVDGLAASAASFIAQAASPGKLEVAPHSQMMIHNGFSMAIGDAADLRQTADLLDKITTEIASIYAERSGKPVASWLAAMAAETWYSDAEAVEAGLADNIHGQDPAPKAEWDLTIYARHAEPEAPAAMTVLNADGTHAPMSGTHEHAHPAMGSQGDDASHSHEHTHDNDADHGHSHADDPDGDGDDDTTAAGDTDHDYVKPDGSPGPKASIADAWPVLAASVDSSPWDAAKAWAAGAASDSPEAFYRAICAGRKAGDPSTQDAWALPYKYSPSSAVNADGVKNALARLPQTKGLTNADQAKATLEKAMKAVNPDYDPDALADTALLAEVFTIPDADVDDSAWNPKAALALAAASSDPPRFFAAICAGRKSGDPATAEAWALPYRYTPGSPPNASGVREALAEMPHTSGLANTDEARSVLDKAMKAINPGPVPDDVIDPALLAAAFANALG